MKNLTIYVAFPIWIYLDKNATTQDEKMRLWQQRLPTVSPAVVNMAKQETDRVPGTDLAKELVSLGRALHIHSLMTASQMRRAVVGFWAILWSGILKLRADDDHN